MTPPANLTYAQGATPFVPDFLIIGAMKAGTTSLASWLSLHPNIAMCRLKEPNFYSEDRAWRKGAAWYQSLYPKSSSPTTIFGEASVSYAAPDRAALVAARLNRSGAAPKSVFLMRDRWTRSVSHYRHEYLKGRERRPALDAITPDSQYALRSQYALGLAPFIQTFGVANLLVMDMEQLNDGEGRGRILSHIGLYGASPPPFVVKNESAEKPRYRPLMTLLYDSTLRAYASRLAPSLRQALRPALFGRPVPNESPPCPAWFEELANRDARMMTMLGVVDD